MDTGVKAPKYQKGKHRYYPCRLCGSEHPSTTTILDVIGSPALMGWNAKMGTKKLLMFSKAIKTSINQEIYDAACKEVEADWGKDEESDFWLSGYESSKEAADYGTQAHAAVEMFLMGKTVDLNALPAPSRTAFEVFRKFSEDNKLETISTETTYYNCRVGYAGTADWSGKINGKLTLADWKTSKGIFEKYIPQCWANVMSDEGQHGDRLYEQILVGRFGRDGSTDILICTRNGRIMLNGKIVESDGKFCSYEQSRVLVEAVVPWFHFKNRWDLVFPYRKKKSVK